MMSKLKLSHNDFTDVDATRALDLWNVWKVWRGASHLVSLSVNQPFFRQELASVSVTVVPVQWEISTMDQ